MTVRWCPIIIFRYICRMYFEATRVVVGGIVFSKRGVQDKKISGFVFLLQKKQLSLQSHSPIWLSWQSNAFVMRRSRVRVPVSAPEAFFCYMIILRNQHIGSARASQAWEAGSIPVFRSYCPRRVLVPKLERGFVFYTPYHLSFKPFQRAFLLGKDYF